MLFNIKKVNSTFAINWLIKKRVGLKKEIKFDFEDVGEGKPMILLHGLMGGLANFNGLIQHFSKKGYRVIAPTLPLYSYPLLKTNVKNFENYVCELVDHLQLKEYILIGNSLGGHISLLHAKRAPENLKGIVLTGSSGLYEKAMGNSFPKRGNYEFIKKKTEEVFYKPEIATKELVDEVFGIVNDKNKVIRTLAIAKSAIRHNMSKDLNDMKIPFCLIWGENDKVTPPEVAIDFNKLLPQSELHWIEKCGHAPMMEHPDQFNAILTEWLGKNY